MKRMTFDEVNNRLTEMGFTPTDISLIIGFTPYQPSRYLGHDAAGLPIQSVVSIYKHITYKGAPVLVGYMSTAELEAHKEIFEALCGDATSRRALGWYKGSSEFVLDLYYDTP